jgi:hypothetical protein
VKATALIESDNADLPHPNPNFAPEIRNKFSFHRFNNVRVYWNQGQARTAKLTKGFNSRKVCDNGRLIILRWSLFIACGTFDKPPKRRVYQTYFYLRDTAMNVIHSYN